MIKRTYLSRDGMKILRATLSTCHEAADLAVAIDVLRAFTTAGYLFHSGVVEILLVAGVQEAFALRDQREGYLLLGEVDGIPIEGFDLGNSPSEVIRKELTGKRVIQRTTAGTQGVVRAAHAKTILTAALTNVSATVRAIRQERPESVMLIQTGFFPGEDWGDEDVACADAIESLLWGQPVDWDKISRRVRFSRSGLHYDGTQSAFPPEDLELALRIDRFHFAMWTERKGGLHILRPVLA